MCANFDTHSVAVAVGVLLLENPCTVVQPRLQLTDTICKINPNTII